jgi:hypothetical protein
MAKLGEHLVLVLLIVVIFYLILRNWLPFSAIIRWLNHSSPQEQEEIKGEVPDLLRDHGYEVIKSKEKTAISMDVNGDSYESRLYIDYLARLGEEWYVVMMARERKPLRLTGAALRDHFLPFYLLYRPKGILYIQKEKGNIQVIQFDLPDRMLTKLRFHWLYVAIISFFLGIILSWQFRS